MDFEAASPAAAAAASPPSLALADEEPSSKRARLEGGAALPAGSQTGGATLATAVEIVSSGSDSDSGD